MKVALVRGTSGAAGTVLVALCLACGSADGGSTPPVQPTGPVTTQSGDPRSATTPPRTATDQSQPPDPTQSGSQDQGVAVPNELAGTWVHVEARAGTVYTFAADGSYSEVSMLHQERPSGTFRFTISARGTMIVQPGRLTLQPVTGTQVLEDPDSATGGWTRPVRTTPQVFEWSVSADGSGLTMTGDTGTIEYTRRSG